jgi:glycosyltransferase involved in cell wall biosynthesis
MVKIKMDKNDNITVIIRNKNESRWIGHAIQSAIDHLIRPEILVIDNNSTDDSLSVVKHFIHDPLLNANTLRYTDIKIIKIENYTPGSAINLGVKNAKNDYVLILSAHCVLKKINFNDLINKSKNYVGIFGNQNPIWNGKKINKRYIWSHFTEIEEENMYSKMEDRYFFHNGASFFRKENLLEYPFYETLLGKEDRYWIGERIKEGKKSLYDPKLEVEHHYTTDGNTWKGIA